MFEHSIKDFCPVGKTTCAPVLATRGAIQPAPALSCADCVQLQQKCAFDITALVAKVSEPRNVGGLRFVRDVFLIDGTVVNGKTALPQIAIFYTNSSLLSEPQEIQVLQKACSTTDPVTIYGIQGAKESGEFKLQSSSNCFSKLATGTPKAMDLSTNGRKIHGIPDADRYNIGGSTFVPHEKRDWSIAQSHETLCAHMAWLTDKTYVDALDDSETVWQINWCEIALCLPEDGAVKTKDGDRLWIRVTVRDCSSHVTLYMTEQSALELASVETAEEWVHTYEDDDFVLPVLASVKIRRVLKKASKSSRADGAFGDASQLAGTAPDDVTMTSVQIVHAMEQPWERRRTETSLSMVTALRASSYASSQMLPADLEMIVTSHQYPLAVRYNQDTIPCLKVLTLIASSSKSKAEDSGEDAFILKTADVVSALDFSGVPENITFSPCAVAAPKLLFVWTPREATNASMLWLFLLPKLRTAL